MTKRIVPEKIIESCYQCPHHANFGWLNECFNCTPANEIPQPMRIPSWCPLEIVDPLDASCAFAIIFEDLVTCKHPERGPICQHQYKNEVCDWFTHPNEPRE